MLNTIMNTLVNPLTIGASLTVVGAAGLVGGMFSDVLSYHNPNRWNQPWHTNVCRASFGWCRDLGSPLRWHGRSVPRNDR